MSHGGGGSERWLVSYADFITLLMVLFVVLYSMGQIDIQRYKQLAEGLRTAFAGGPERVVDAGIDQAGGTKDNETAAPIIVPGIPKVPVDEAEVAGELTDLLAASNLGGAVSVQNNIEGVLIALSEKLVFAPGTAELQADAYPVLDTIIEMIRPIDNEIRIIGHTDNTPPDPLYVSNWGLSVARALVIEQYLESHGIHPSRLSISGRGEHQPIFPNDSPEHRSLNSRAEIIVVYQVGTNVIDLNLNAGSGSNPGGAPGQP